MIFIEQPAGIEKILTPLGRWPFPAHSPPHSAVAAEPPHDGSVTAPRGTGGVRPVPGPAAGEASRGRQKQIPINYPFSIDEAVLTELVANANTPTSGLLFGQSERPRCLPLRCWER